MEGDKGSDSVVFAKAGGQGDGDREESGQVAENRPFEDIGKLLSGLVEVRKRIVCLSDRRSEPPR